MVLQQLLQATTAMEVTPCLVTSLLTKLSLSLSFKTFKAGFSTVNPFFGFNMNHINDFMKSKN